MTSRGTRRVEDGEQQPEKDLGALHAGPPLLSGVWSSDAYVQVLEKLDARPTVAYVLVSDGLSEKCVFFPAGGLRLTSVGQRRGRALSAALRAHPRYSPAWESTIRAAADDGEKGLEDLADGELREAYKEVSAAIVQDELLDLVVWEGADFEYRESNPPPVIFSAELEAVKLSLGVRQQLQEVRQAIDEWRGLLRKVGDPERTQLTARKMPPGKTSQPGRALHEAVARAPQATMVLVEAVRVGRAAGGTAVALMREVVAMGEAGALALVVSPPPPPAGLRRRRAQENVDAIEAALEKLINRLAAHRRLAEEYDELGEQEKAVEHLRVVGEELKVREDWEGALQLYRNVLDLLPHAFFAREEVAGLLQQLKRGPEALLEWLRLAKEMAKLRLFNRAQRNVRQAVALDPEDPDLRRYLIDCLTAAGRKDAAAEEYRGLGELLQRLGRNQEALACFQELLELRPGDTLAAAQLRAAAESARGLPVKALALLGACFLALLGGSAWVYQRHLALLAFAAAREEALGAAAAGRYADARARLDEVDDAALAPRVAGAKAVVQGVEEQEAALRLAQAKEDEGARRLGEAYAGYQALKDGFPGTAAAQAAGERLAALQKLAGEARQLVAAIEALVEKGEGAAAFARSRELLERYGWTDVARGFLVPVPIETAPPGATVVLKGERQEAVTPCVLRVEWTEPWKLGLLHEGCEELEQTVDLKALRAPLRLSLPRKTRWVQRTDGPILTPLGLGEGRLLVVSTDQCLYSIGSSGRLSWVAPRGEVPDRLALLAEVRGPALRLGDSALVAEAGGALRWFSLESGQLVRSQPDLGAGLRALGVLGSRALLLADEALLAIDREGKQLWRVPLPARALAGALDREHERALVSLAGGKLIVIDVAKGAAFRPFELGAELTASPAPAPGGALVATADGKLALRWTAPRWSVPLAGEVRGAPVADAERCYVAHGDRVSARAVADGAELWQVSLPGARNPVLAGGRLYVTGAGGRLLALDAARGVVRWEFSCEGELLAPVAVEGSTVFVPSSDFSIYALTD
ncbi:MAG: PQQ-binding-like beta-propeller repeat protein [Planctomycetota bacterium]